MARILIANQNASMTAYLQTSLKKAAHVTTVVDNALEAWRATSQADFDIMLIDVSMHGIDSFVIAQKALQDNPLLQIIFLTGFSGVAMDTFATPSYAPAPVTMQAFHLKDIASHIRHLQTGSSFFAGSGVKTGSGEVIYADFTAKTVDTTIYHAGT